MKTPLLLVAIAASCAAQQPAVWYVIDYMKVLPANADAYVKNETLIKPVQQDRVAKGQILSWALYSVRFSGTKSEYDHVRVTAFDDYAKIISAPFTDEQRKHIVEIRGAGAEVLRDLVRTDIVRELATAGTLHAPWLGVSFIKSKPGMEQERRNDETKFGKPLYDARLKAGGTGLRGWGAAFVQWPSGANVEYDIVTARAFDSFGASGAPETGFEAQRAEANRNTALHGVTVKRELWQLMSGTDPAK